MRHEPTEAERVLWQHLRHLDVAGSHFRRQATIGAYFADFACHAARLVIEIDGGQHNEAAGLARDAKRTAELEARGYCVLRFWNNDVLGNVEGVMETIAAAVRDVGPPPPTPPRHASLGGWGAESTGADQSKRPGTRGAETP
jgi:very-short-patch-repair endonuclease